MEDRTPTRDEVRQALLCLYNLAELGRTHLAALVCPEAAGPVERGQAVRRLLLDTIEELRPTGPAPPLASEYRAHECVTLRYISSYSIDDIGEQLSLSRRQVYRDLQYGEERLTELLQEHLQAMAAPHPTGNALTQEIRALERRPQPVALVSLVRGAVSVLSPLASEHSTSIEYHGPEGDVTARATPGILREAIVQIISAVVQGGQRRPVPVRLQMAGVEAILEIGVGLVPEGGPGRLLHDALLVIQAEGLPYELVPEQEGHLLRLRVPLERRYKVLIVEDNPSASTLYERYLENSQWEPVIVPHPRLATSLASSREVRAIILDIMMPETDGWSVLQALKLDPRTADIPVIVCSVVNDQALGRVLGASAYLTKPIGRPALLQALEEAARQYRPVSRG